MSNADIISMAVRNLLKRKLRTFLTVLGVVIGTAAIVVMISLGIGMNESFMKQLETMGDITSITVYKPFDGSGGMMYMGNGVAVSSSQGGSSQSKNEMILDDNAVRSFENIPGVVVATPFLEFSLKAVSGKFESWVQVRGIDPRAMSAMGYEVREGRLLEETDKLNLVFGYEVPFQFYNPNDRSNRFYSYYDGNGPDERVYPINVLEDKMVLTYDWSYGSRQDPYSEENTVEKPKPYKVKGVGILTYSGYNNNYYVFMNITQAQKIKEAQEKYQDEMSGGAATGKKKDKGYERAMVKCTDINVVKEVQQAITAMGFESDTPSQMLDSMKEIYGSIQGLLGAVGAVSLFVAAIGIANTMIMAIYERTREIGIMKVVGASIKDIKKLFLLEAALIGFFGGLIGVGLSLAVSLFINNVGISFFNMMSAGGDSKISSVPMWLCLVALLFSATIGLVSGYFPARRAMNLSALSAIRTE